MTREEAIMILKEERWYMSRYSEEYEEAYNMAIEALQADVVSREEAIQAVDKCRERKNKEIEQLREFYSQNPTIPTFKESEEAYKAWTGEEMGKTSDEINEMNNEIIKDILKMMPTAYLLEALGVATFEELMESADRPHGEWVFHANFSDESQRNDYDLICTNCGELYRCDCQDDVNDFVWNAHYCMNCGAYMGGEEE